MASDATFHKSARQLEDEGPSFTYTTENRARFEEINLLVTAAGVLYFGG